MELRKVNELFNDCYKLYKNFCQTDLTDNDLHEFIKASDLIHKKYNTKFSEAIVIAVIDEIDRKAKEKEGGYE